MAKRDKTARRSEAARQNEPLRLYFYPDRDFEAPACLDARHAWLTPELLVSQPTDGEGERLPATRVVTEPGDADFIVFPYWLSSVTNMMGVTGTRQFVAGLPLFSRYEDRHVFALEHDVSTLLGIRSVVFHTSVNRYHKDSRAIAYPFRVHDFGELTHYDYSRMEYHTSFVGNTNSWSGRPLLVESIKAETRLNAWLDPVTQFHGHWASGAVREERRQSYIASLADSMTVLCPRGAGQNTIRFFEVLSMGRIPILVSDTCALPFEDEIDYGSFTLRIPEALLDRAGSILAEWLARLTPEQIIAMCRAARQTWERYFQERQVWVQTVRALHRLKMASNCPARVSGAGALSALPAPPITRETTWLASGIQVWLSPEGRMLEANGVQGGLTPGDGACLFHTARLLPLGATVVEVGSFVGLSAILMANGLVASHNHSARIACVDTWEASPEHQSMNVVRDRGLFDRFLDNVRNSGTAGLIRPIRKASVEAAAEFAPGTIDLLFLDGNHSYPSCYANLAAWYPKLRLGGLFVGHGRAPDCGVRQAVTEFAASHGLLWSITELPAGDFMFELKPASPVLPADIRRGETFVSWGLPNATFARVETPAPAGKEAAPDDRTRAAADLVDTLQQVQTAHAGRKWKRAAKLLQHAIELSVAASASPADQATLWNSLGFALMMRQQLPAAEAAFEKGLALDPQHADLLANLANVSMQRGRFERALECLRQATRQEPSSVSLLIAEGKCALELGALDAALHAFRRALGITPDNQDLRDAVMRLQARQAQ